jgi:hypothetical protein
MVDMKDDVWRRTPTVLAFEAIALENLKQYFLGNAGTNLFYLVCVGFFAIINSVEIS